MAYHDEKFALIRDMDNISSEDICKSFKPEFNRKAVFKAGQGAGKSGSFFFFSSDNKFIIKTLKPEEKELLFSMLDPMLDHFFSECNSESMLARIYGVFSLKTNIFSNLDVIVMQNTVQLKNKKNPKMIFDLKGSRINRYVNLPSEEQNFWKKTPNQRRCMKDLNLLEIEQSLESKFVTIDSDIAEQIAYQLEKDSHFLAT